MRSLAPTLAGSAELWGWSQLPANGAVSMQSARDDDVVGTRVAHQRFGQGRVDRATTARVIGVAEPEDGACRLAFPFEEERGSDRPADARQTRKAPAELL